MDLGTCRYKARLLGTLPRDFTLFLIQLAGKMVALTDVKASNERIASTFPEGLVAIFVGGTSGVGEYTLKKFAKYAPNSRVYIVGRSQEAADRIIRECCQLSPRSKFDFIKADVSLLKNVDQVCRQIKSKESAVNILFQSQGSMAYDSSKYFSKLLRVTHSRVDSTQQPLKACLLPFAYPRTRESDFSSISSQ